MGISLSITDGTTTVSLSGTSPVLGCTYFPQTSQQRNGEWQPVTEQAEVNLRGTAATIRSTIASIRACPSASSRRRSSTPASRHAFDHRTSRSRSSLYITTHTCGAASFRFASDPVSPYSCSSQDASPEVASRKAPSPTPCCANRADEVSVADRRAVTSWFSKTRASSGAVFA